MSEPLDLIDPFDDCPWCTPREILRRLGYEPLPPSAIDDFQIRGRLWELLYALAARRFYLYNTNHLSDRELYAWLYDDWLNEETADIPPEAEWNCRVAPNDSGCEEDSKIWLRYYADEDTRQEWAIDFPEDPLPPHEEPQFDRDRWLPDPPVPPPSMQVDDDEPFPFDEDLSESSLEDESDPLGLNAVDAQISGAGDVDEIHATAGEEPEAWQRPIDKLKNAGQQLLPPDELTEEALPAKVWELLHNLACQGFYIKHSDHLSDRQIYSELWKRGLRDEALLPGKSKTGAWYHDFLGSWGEDDLQIWLRFYATDKERTQHQMEWQNDTIPSKEMLPYNRDWRLPKGPF